MENNMDTTFIENLKVNTENIKEIVSHVGKFLNNFDQIENYVDSVNRLKNNYKEISIKSIKNDLQNMILESINFEEKANELKNFMKNKNPNKTIPKLEYFKLKNSDIDDFEMDSIIDAYDQAKNISTEDKSTAVSFNKARKNAVNYINEFIESASDYETNMVQERDSKIELLKNNVEKLFEIHKLYAWNAIHKQKNFENIPFGKKNIKLYRSQKEFITNAIKSMLD